MQIFFRTIADIETFRANLHMIRCPKCRKTGTMVKHGYKWGFTEDAQKQKCIRRWRIRCKPSKGRQGCGHTPSVALSETIPRHCFSASDLWRFMIALKKSRSIKAAWELAGMKRSLDTAYRLYRRLCLCQSRLRTNLTSRAPPPEAKEMSAPLFQVFEHLKESFGQKEPVKNYQEYLQQSILITN